MGDSFEKVVQLMREAVPAHIAGLIEDGLPVPPPSTMAVHVHVDARLTRLPTYRIEQLDARQESAEDVDS